MYCKCDNESMNVSVRLGEVVIKKPCMSLKEIPEILSNIAKEHEINLSDCIIELTINGGAIGEVGVVFHNDLETLEKSLSEYMFVVVGKNLLKRIV